MPGHRSSLRAANPLWCLALAAFALAQADQPSHNALHGRRLRQAAVGYPSVLSAPPPPPPAPPPPAPPPGPCSTGQPIYFTMKCTVKTDVYIAARRDDVQTGEDPNYCMNGTAWEDGWCLRKVVVPGNADTFGPVLATSSRVFYYFAEGDKPMDGSAFWWGGDSELDIRLNLDNGNNCSEAGGEQDHGCDTMRRVDISCTDWGAETPQSYVQTLGCDFPNIRLAGGNRTAGRLETKLDKEWGKVCQAGFTDTTAGVACRELGIADSGRAVSAAGFEDTDNAPVVMADVACNGNETSLTNCAYSMDNVASCAVAVGVECFNATQREPIQGVRLVGGANGRTGRLEVLMRGAWGTVCDDGVDDASTASNIGAVVCRGLGFASGRALINGETDYGPGRDQPIWLESLRCNGSESSLNECSFSTVTDCSHLEDLSIICVDMDQPAPAPATAPAATAAAAAKEANAPSTSPSPSSSSLSTGAIAGIAAGCAALALLAVLGGFLLLRRRKRAGTQGAAAAADDPSKPGSSAPSQWGAAGYAGLPGAAVPGYDAEVDTIIKPAVFGKPATGAPSDPDKSLSLSGTTGGMPPPGTPSIPNSLADHSSTAAASRSAGSAGLASSDPLTAYLLASQSSSQQDMAQQGSGLSRQSGQSGQSGQLLVVQPWTISFRDVTLLEEVGSGSFGRVYKARWREIAVAVKVLLPGSGGALAGGSILSARDAQHALSLAAPLVSKLEEEAALLASLRHPHIVSFYGIVSMPPCIVTEFCARGSLYELLYSARTNASLAGQLTWRRRLALALDAALGMLYLHGREPAPLLHRDLKSPNMLIGADWCLKIGDFGTSRVMDGLDEAHLSASTAGVTNPRWLAPEVLRGERATRATDVYSFGVVLHELATWQLPWGTTQHWQIVGNVLAGAQLEVPPRSQLPGPDSAGFQGLDEYLALMRRCCSVEPGQRPGFDDIVPQLRSLLEEEEARTAAGSS